MMFRIPPVVIPTMAKEAFPSARNRLFRVKDPAITGAA